MDLGVEEEEDGFADVEGGFSVVEALEVVGRGSSLLYSAKVVLAAATGAWVLVLAAGFVVEGLYIVVVITTGCTHAVLASSLHVLSVCTVIVRGYFVELPVVAMETDTGA